MYVGDIVNDPSDLTLLQSEERKAALKFQTASQSGLEYKIKGDFATYTGDGYTYKITSE